MKQDDTEWSLERRLYEDRYPDGGHELDINPFVNQLYRELVNHTHHMAISRKDELEFLLHFDLEEYLESIRNDGIKLNLQVIMNKEAKTCRRQYRNYVSWVKIRLAYGY